MRELDKRRYGRDDQRERERDDSQRDGRCEARNQYLPERIGEQRPESLSQGGHAPLRTVFLFSFPLS